MHSEPKTCTMITKTAWKNVWRNRLRSLVVIASVSIGVFGGVFSVAVMNGAIEQRVGAAINREISHIHINDPAFRDNYDPKLVLPSAEELAKNLAALEGVRAITGRNIISGMANTARKSTGVQILGVDPEKEKEVFKLHETTIPGTGNFFESKSRHKLAYIGEELAKDLNIIRYIIDENTLDSLKEKGIPEEVLVKLEPYLGRRFKSETAFKKEMKQVLTSSESKKYGRHIRAAAWSFRKRSRLTLTFLDKDQIQTGGVFRIAGIYNIRNSIFEMSQIMVRNEDLAELTGMSTSDLHQLVVALDDTEKTEEITEAIKALYPDLEVMHWKEIQPDLAMMTDLMQQFYAILMMIILAALAFGIVNTMLMIVLERTRELGMLGAIGMNKKRVFGMIMLESVFLAIVGGIIGMLISSLVIAISSRRGIHLNSYQDGFEAMGITSDIYPHINGSFFIVVSILIVLTGILSSVYPALKALKLNPAEALRSE